MFSRASFRNLKHMAKKGIMKRVGLTESTPEDPRFKALLVALDRAKRELKGIYNTTRDVVISGKMYNKNLEKFCGPGLKGENLYNKETEFLRVIEERLYPTLGRIITKHVDRLSMMIIEYKTAKLKFDSTQFQTVKDIQKQGSDVAVENPELIMQSNPDLVALKEAYIVSKDKVREQRDVIVSQLQNNVRRRLTELTEASDTHHHRMYCRYFKERLTKMVEMFGDGALRARSATFTHLPTRERC